MGPGYQALREGAAFLDLSARGRIFALGEDRARLLHAMTTNQVRELQPGQGCYVFFLNAQGRILADANLFVLADRILIDLEPELRRCIFEHLDKYIIADDVTLEDVSESGGAYAVEGPGAAAALAGMGAPPVPEAPYSHVDWDGRILARVSVTGAPGFRVFGPVGQSTSLIPADAESIRVVRLEHGKPRYGDDIFDTTLPQETQQSHALNFNKGCYLGQEIVERIRSRGHVNRMLAALRIDSQEPPAAGAKILAESAEVGEITSAAFSPGLGKVVALGYVRGRHGALTVDGHAAAPAPPAEY